MVNKRMKARAVLSLVTRTARKAGFEVEELRGHGKGSHHVYIIRNMKDKEVGRFTLTSHSKDVSWTVLKSIEDGLEHLFGERWMEKK